MKKQLLIFVICAMMLTACSMPVQDGKNAAGGTTSAAETVNPDSSANSPENTGTPSSEAAQAATPAPGAEAASISDYFPFVKDVYMTYKGTGNEYASYDTFVDYIRGDKIQLRKNNGGTEAVLIYQIRDDKLINTFSRGETYYKYDFTSMSDGEDILLKEPFAEGTEWTAKDGSKRSITSVDSQVETPSGKYTAIEVTTLRKDSTDKDYYVKGIGLVKSVFSTGDPTAAITSELQKIEKDVPYVREINCYYPQFETDKVVYMAREIAIKTNEDMKFKFQKELKIIPETGGLTKTFTKNTKVLGIKLDEEKGTVTADLSSDFITEMNAGTSLETLLLDSVVNTLGDYYMKSRVIITINGKPYESGHILMREGEAFDVRMDKAAQFR